MKAYTKEKLLPLIKKNQRTLTLEDVDAIVELDRIAGRIEKGVKQVSERDWFEIDGHFFKRITFAREQLMKRIFQRHGSGMFDVVGTLYALDIDRTEAEIQSTPNKLQLIKYACKLDISISKCVEELTNKLGISDNEVIEDESEKQDDFDSWKLCCFFADQIGGSPNEWMDATESKMESARKYIEEKIEAEEEAYSSKSKRPPKETPKLLAIAEFSKKLKALEASWQAAEF